MGGGDRRSGRPPGRPALTLRDIAAAGLALVGREGLDALSMRRLADELGIQAASLYWHVPSKDALIDVMADELLADLPLPRPSSRKGWRRAIREHALGYYHYLLGRRDAARIIARRFGVAPNFLPHVELLGEHLLGAGFSTRDAANAIYAIVVYVQGFACHQSFAEVAEPDREAGAGAPAGAATSAGARVRLLSMSPAQFPATAALIDSLAKPDPERQFAFGLDRLLDGLETMARRG